jgi:hypothetical protein
MLGWPLRLCLPEVVCGVWEAGSGMRQSLVTPPFARPLHLRHGVGDLVQCPLPHQMLWTERDERLLRTLPVVQHGISLLFLSV